MKTRKRRSSDLYRWRLPAIVPVTLLVLQACSSSGSPSAPPDDPAGGGDGEDTDEPVDAVVYPDDFLEGFDDPYADGFDVDSLYVQTFSYSETTGSSSAALEDDGLVLRAQSDGIGYANRYARFSAMPEKAVLKASFDERTTLSPESNSNASVTINATLFSTVPDLGLDGDQSSYGNVSLFYRVVINAAGESNAAMCLDIYGEDGFQPYGFGEDNTHCWQAPSSSDLVEGEEFQFGYDFNRVERTLLVQFNDEDELTIDLPDELYEVPGEQIGVQSIQEGGEGESVVRLMQFQLDERLYDMASDPIVLDRVAIRQDEGSGPVAPQNVDGQLQFEVESTDGNYREGTVEPLSPSDYLEAVLTLSSVTLGERGRVQARLENTIYNALPLDARDGRMGDVRASIELVASYDGTREALICLVESQDRDFDDSQGLLDDGDRRCSSLPMIVEMDTPYRVAIALVRGTSSVIFRVNGLVVTEEISTMINDASRPSGRVIINVDDGASTVALVDNIRTSPTALTDSEVREGLEAPPVFPAAEEPRVAESDVSPGFNYAQKLDFVDDFSVNSATLGFNSNVERGQAGIEYSEGGIELRTANHPEQADNGSYSEVYVNGDTQSIKARVRLSSDTDLPPDSEATARMRLQGALFRDNQDYPLNDRTGDIYSSIEINVRGDGRRRIQYYVSRRVEGAEDEQLTIIDGENSGHFEELVPELGTTYELGMKLDTERNMLIFSVDGKVREIPLPWQAYRAARNDAMVQVSHQGTSGRAVGTLFSVETDSIAEDYAAELPLIGPYRPTFEARYRSQSVQISDGSLRLSSDSRVPGSQPARLIARGESDHVSADLMLSSSSVVSSADGEEGMVMARVGGLMYRALAALDRENSTGEVFAAASLVSDSDGGIYAEFCAFQSLDSGFDDVVELISGDADNCSRFNTPVQWDTYYPLSVAYNEEAATLVFTLGSESVTYSIATDVFPVGDGFQGVQSLSLGQSLAVVHADNLAYSETPVALAESAQRLLVGEAL